MADKAQRRGNREVRKPKQPKAKPAAPVSPFVATVGKIVAGRPARGKSA